MKKILSFVISAFVLLGTFSYIPQTVAYALNEQPTGVCMTFYSDIYSRGFAWQTSQAVTESKVLLVKDNGGEINWNNAQVINGTTKDFQGYRYHNAYIENLEPGAKYLYKVGGSGAYSDVGSFTVEKESTDKASFIYVTDSQETSLEGFENFRKTLVTAKNEMPEANFIAFLGDLVDNSHANWGNDYSKIKMEEWSYAFDVPKEVIMHTPFMSVAGNHESAGETFIDHSTIKYDGTSNTGGYYSFDYGPVHVIGLNGNAANNESNFKPQLEWLKADLASTDKEWKVVMIHQGVYSTGDHSNDSDCLYLRSVLPPIMAEYEVDLVLQGHDHVYTRTMPYLYGEGENGKVANRNELLVPVEKDGETLNYSMEADGTYYVTINYAGTKSYPPVEYDTGRVFPATSPVNGKLMSQQVRNRMFATVEFENNELVFKSFVAYDDGTCELYDYFAVRKNTYQQADAIISALPDSTAVTARNAREIYSAKQEVEALSERALKRLGEAQIQKLDDILNAINVNDALKAVTVIEKIDALLAKNTYDAQFWADYSEAKNLYYNLSNAQMQLVLNREGLLGLDDNLIQGYAVKQVQALIDVIEKSANKEQARLIASEAYNLLSESGKAQIKNAHLLQAGEPTGGCNSTLIIVFGSIVAALCLATAIFFVLRRGKNEKK